MLGVFKGRSLDKTYRMLKDVLALSERTRVAYHAETGHPEDFQKSIVESVLKGWTVRYPSHVFLAHRNGIHDYVGKFYWMLDKDVLAVEGRLSQELPIIQDWDHRFHWYNGLNQPLTVVDSMETPFKGRVPKALSVRNLVITQPIFWRGEGLLMALNYNGEVSDHDATILRGYSAVLGLHDLVYHHRRTTHEHPITLYHKISKLAETETEDPESTANHMKRMSKVAEIIAKELEKHAEFRSVVTPDFVHMLHLSAPIHDIGKIWIPNTILSKPGPLTTEEFEIVKEHTVLGGKLLEGYEPLKMAWEIALYHHEKFNGTGYPFGLEGDHIPLAARIVSVADAFDVITSKRVYKEARSFDEAVVLIKQDSGKHFDPRIVTAFLSSLKSIHTVLVPSDAKTQ